MGLLSYVVGGGATPLGVLPNTARLTGVSSTFGAITLAVSDADENSLDENRLPGLQVAGPPFLLT